MVRLAGFAAINTESRRAQDEAAQQTLEAQEARVIGEYENALERVRSGDFSAAEVAFCRILDDPLVVDSATERLQRVRFLSLKNLAGVVAGAGKQRASEALSLFHRAVSEDPNDVALWDRFGTLAAQSGEWAASKSAFQEVLRQDPRHPTASAKLLQVLMHVGDYSRAESLAKAAVASGGHHPFARRIAAEGAAAAGQAALLSLPDHSAHDGHGNEAAPVPVTAPVRKATWRHLLERCAELLSDPATAMADVSFQLPPDTVVPTPVAPAAAATAAAATAVPMETEAEEDEVIDIETVGPTPPPPAVQSAETTTHPATNGAPAASADQPQQPTQAAEGAGPSAAAPSAAPEKAAPAPSPARAVRSTRGCKGQARAEAVSAEKPKSDEDADKLSFLRVLVPLLYSKPEDAAVAAESSKNPSRASSKSPADSEVQVKQRAGDAQEASEVRGSEVVGGSASFSAVEASARLVRQWTRPEAAARLVQLGAAPALLRVAAWLEEWQWRWSGALYPLGCLILGELFADAAFLAARAAAGTGNAANTQSRSHELSYKELQRGGELWLARFRSSRFLSGPGDEADGSARSAAEARYWWARGRLQEAAARPLDAAASYRNCSTALSQCGSSTGNYEIELPHCEADAFISEDSVAGKLELLQLHDVLSEAERTMADGQHALAAAVLAPVLLDCTPREDHMAMIDRRTWSRALRVLIACCAATDDPGTALRCHLRLLRAGLPQPPDAVEAVLKNPDFTPAAANPQQQQQLPLDPTQADDLLQAARHLETQFDGVQTSLATAPLHPLERRALHAVLKQALGLCYTCVDSLPSGTERRSLMSSREAALRHALSDAAIVAMQLWALDDEAQHSPEADIDWCFNLTETLGDAHALGERQGAFVAVLTQRLIAAAPACQAAAQAAAAGDTDVSYVETSLWSGLRYCLYWLYGVKLVAASDEPWGGAYAAESPPAGGMRPPVSQGEVLSLWPLVADELLAQSSSALAKHKEFLEAVSRMFPSLPPTLQSLADAAWAEMASQPAPEVGAAGVVNPLEGLVARAMEADTVDGQTPTWAVFLPVYSSLYRLRTLVHPTVQKTVELACPGEGMLDRGADAALSVLFSARRADLVFNPRRYAGWKELAESHYEAANLTLDTAAEMVPARQWRHRTDLLARVASHRRLGHWATAAAALYVSSPDDSANLLKLAGNTLYAEVANAPPTYDQLTLRPGREDPRLVAAAEAALRAFQAAAALFPEDWELQMQVGRCSRRLDRPPSEWLPAFARSCHLALVHHSGLLDPIYTLHAARLKLLAKLEAVEGGATGEEGSAVLRLVGRYCFSREAQEACAALDAEMMVAPATMTRAAQAMYADGVAAMQWCLEKNKYFHRASAMRVSLNWFLIRTSF